MRAVVIGVNSAGREARQHRLIGAVVVKASCRRERSVAVARQAHTCSLRRSDATRLPSQADNSVMGDAHALPLLFSGAVSTAAGPRSNAPLLSMKKHAVRGLEGSLSSRRHDGSGSERAAHAPRGHFALHNVDLASMLPQQFERAAKPLVSMDTSWFRRVRQLVNPSRCAEQARPFRLLLPASSRDPTLRRTLLRSFDVARSAASKLQSVAMERSTREAQRARAVARRPDRDPHPSGDSP